jgi:hypothetical protein
MIKHILTKECSRNCSYCISKKVYQEQNTDLNSLITLYSALANLSGIKEIMLTGGEPTMAANFWQIVYTAISYFPKVFITTQNPSILRDETAAKAFAAITFSLHSTASISIPMVNTNAVVYAGILDNLFYEELPYELKENGFAGLTINENYFGNEQFTGKVPLMDDFSIRINKRGKCINEPVILPDLSVAKSFNEYLK